MSDLQKLYDYIDAHAKEYIDWMVRYLRQPSVPGMDEDMQKTADMLVQDLQKLGFSTDVVPANGYPMKGYPIVYAEQSGKQKERTVICYGHYDTQMPEPLDEWITPPFSADIRDGKIYARGAADEKGPTISKLCAINAIEAVYGQIPLNIRFILEGDEEIGSPNMKGFVAKYPERAKCDAILWGGGERLVNKGPQKLGFGVNGLCYVELSVCTANIDQHSMYAAILENPAWRLVKALNTLKDLDTDRILIDGFYDDVAPVSQKEIDYLETFPFDEEELKNRMQLRRYVNDLSGMELKKKWYFEPTCNICGIHSGYQGEQAKTLLPYSASCMVDFRLVPNQDPDDILQKLRKHLDDHGFADIQIKPKSGVKPYRSNLETAYTQTLIDCAKELYPPELPPVVLPNVPGTSSMYALCGVSNAPAAFFGPSTDDSQFHAPNEHIDLEDYILGVKLVAAVLMRYADTKG